MPSKHVIYVRLEDGRVGILDRIDSTDKRGKYAVTPSGSQIPSYFSEIKQRITHQEYLEYKPTKQPAKRSKKNV